MSFKTLTAFSVIDTLSTIIGIIFYYIGLPIVTIISACLSILDSILQVKYGDQNSLATEVITVIIGVIVALIAKISIIPCVAVTICFGSAILGVFSLFILFTSHPFR